MHCDALSSLNTLTMFALLYCIAQHNANGLEVNATVEQYVANKRAQREAINDFLDSIEDLLSPAAPLQVRACKIRLCTHPYTLGSCRRQHYDYSVRVVGGEGEFDS